MSPDKRIHQCESSPLSFSLTSKQHLPFFECHQVAFHALAIIFIPVTSCLKTVNVALNFINGSIMLRTWVLIALLHPGLGRPHVDHCVPSWKHILRVIDKWHYIQSKEEYQNGECQMRNIKGIEDI